MLTWALTFFVLALIAGVLGFSGVEDTMSGMAQILFVLFLNLLVVSFVMRALRGRPPV